MHRKKQVLLINGSASQGSSNERLINNLVDDLKVDYEPVVFNDLKKLPHFDPALSSLNPPELIVAFRDQVEKAAGVIICTPEYVFSIPSGLKNAIEWCVATTVFSDKPLGLITASANGQKGHEELQLIMKTVMAKFTEETTLLISGIKGKIDQDGNILDTGTGENVRVFVKAFKELVA